MRFSINLEQEEKEGSTDRDSSSRTVPMKYPENCLLPHYLRPPAHQERERSKSCSSPTTEPTQKQGKAKSQPGQGDQQEVYPTSSSSSSSFFCSFLFLVSEPYP